MTTVYFWVPDISHATGGLRVAYRAVDGCNAAGIEAAIMHQRPGFRARWFSNETRVVSAEVQVRNNDVLVVSEFDAARLIESTPGLTKVIFNQNHFWTFVGGPVEYRHPDVASVATVSQDGIDYLEHAFPGLSCFRVHGGVNTDLFVPGSGQRERTIAFLSSKGPEIRHQVLSMLTSRGLPKGWAIKPLSGLKQEALASILGRTAIFTAFSQVEGCQLVLTEAMAAGCAAVGYPAGAGKEYLTEDLAWPVGLGEIVPFSKRIEEVMTAWDTRPDDVIGKTVRAREFVVENYPLPGESADILAALGPALQRAQQMPADPSYSVLVERRLAREALRRVKVAGKTLIGRW